MKLVLVLLGVISLSFVSCQKQDKADANKEGQFTIISTIGMIGNVAETISGDYAVVNNIIGEGVDPHLYKPTVSDMKQLSGADLIFYNGIHLEGKMGEVLNGLKEKGKPVYAVAEEALKENPIELIKEEGEDDPHLWMDVKVWADVSNKIGQLLGEFDAKNKEFYSTQANEYQAKLAALDSYASAVLSSIPEEKRVLITAHDAFNYLSKAYGVEVRGIQGLSTESEAGLKDLEELIEFIVECKIPSVFVESSVSDKNVKALVEGAKAQGHELTIGGELFSDAMGAEGTYEGTYIGMIDHNVTTIARALGGSAPEGGFQSTMK